LLPLAYRGIIGIPRDPRSPFGRLRFRFSARSSAKLRSHAFEFLGTHRYYSVHVEQARELCVLAHNSLALIRVHGSASASFCEFRCNVRAGGACVLSCGERIKSSSAEMRDSANQPEYRPFPYRDYRKPFTCLIPRIIVNVSLLVSDSFAR